LTNYNISNLSLEQLTKKYSDLLTKVDEFEDLSKKKDGYHIADILIMPIQRIPRYIMLIDQLIKFSYSGTNEIRYLENALEKFSDTLCKINNEIDLSLSSNMEKIVQIRNTFLNCSEQNFPVNLKRSFVKEGKLTVTKISNPEKKKLIGKKTYAFLFDDYFLLCTSKKDKKDDIEKLEIVESFTNTIIQNVSLLKKKDFKITLNSVISEEWVFELKTEEESTQWTSLLSNFIK